MTLHIDRLGELRTPVVDRPEGRTASNERMGLMARLAVAEGRLAAFAESPPPGLTDPDPATGERWDAGQAWAHVAEFVPYWQNELERVVAGARRGADPVPFGRTTEDPGRVGAIEAGRHQPPAEQMAHLASAMGRLGRTLSA